MRFVMLFLALGFFNFVFVLWIPITVFSVLFAFGLVAVIFIATPLFIMFSGGAWAWFLFFISLVLCGIGILFGLLVWYGVKIALPMFKWYVNLNIQLLKGVA